MTAEKLLGLLAARPRIVLALFCLFLWVPGGFSLPPLDRDESRFAQASKQMVETGDLVDIRFGAVPRYKKPVGIYWLQSASTVIAGFGEKAHIWTYRLPSLFGALIAVLLTFWCASGFASREAALLSAAFLGGTLLLTGEATIATTDAVLLASILGAQAVLMRVYLAARGQGEPLPRWVVLAGWVSFGVAVLVKGPVIFAVTGLTALILTLWERDGRWLKGTHPLLGLVIVLAMAAPWIIAIGLKSHWQFFQQSLGQDFATKLQGGQESHGFPPGYFLIALTPSFWPAVLFLLPGFAVAVREHREPVMRFLLAWTMCWIGFELVPTKLPHYVLPIYPALAIMAGLWVMTPRAVSGIWGKVAIYAAPVQFAIGGLLFAAALVALPIIYGNGLIFWLIIPALAIIALTGLALLQYFRETTLSAALFALATALVLYPVLTLGAGPQLTKIWVSPRLADTVHALSHPSDPPPALAGFIEPSAVFLLGTKTRLTNGVGAADAGIAQGGLAVVEEREEAAFLSRLSDRDATAQRVGEVGGLNYSNGRKVRIRIWRVLPVTDIPPPPAE